MAKYLTKTAYRVILLFGEGVAQTPEVCGPVASTVRKQGEVSAGIPLAPFISFIQPSTVRDLATHIQGGFPHLSYTSRNTVTDTPRGVSPR